MRVRSLSLAGGLAAAVLCSAAAQAVPGMATGNVNMRTGPSTGYAVITTIPVGAPVEVHRCDRWCEVSYAGRRGWASGNYIASGYAVQPVPVVPPTVYAYRPAPPPQIYWRYGHRPWWDDRYRRWRDRDRWWYDNRWHDRPGVNFQFGFGN